MLASEFSKFFSQKFFADSLFIARLSMRDQYKNSILGMTWSLVQPVMQIAIMAVVFSILLRIEMESYIVYVISGILPWQFFVNGITRGSSAICNRRNIFVHSALPKTMFIIADVLTQFYTFMITLGVAVLISLAQKGFSPVLLTLPLYLLPLLITTFSAAIMFAYVSAYIWDTPHVLGILFQSLAWTVPIMYPLSLIPEHLQVFFKYNPLYALVAPMQSVLYFHQLPSIALLAESVLVAAATCGVSYWVYRRLRKHIIYYI